MKNNPRLARKTPPVAAIPIKVIEPEDETLQLFLRFLEGERNASAHTINSYRIDILQFAELSLDPEMQEVLGSIDQAQLESFIQTISIVSGLISLIPLAWVLPMRKKILKAMNEGTTLTTGFKICTLLFVNFIAGILLLCSQDI